MLWSIIFFVFLRLTVYTEMVYLSANTKHIIYDMENYTVPVPKYCAAICLKLQSFELKIDAPFTPALTNVHTNFVFFLHFFH